METLKFRIKGTNCLIMHNARLANPLDPIAKAIKQITSKRKKTDEDIEEIMWLEFQGGLYHDPDVGPYIPGRNMFASIKEAAKLSRRGTDVDRSLDVVEELIRLEYKGPRDPRGLFDMIGEKGGRQFVDVRRMIVGQASVMRCRPSFPPPWSAEFTVRFDLEVFNPADVVGFVCKCGLMTGLLDGRPREGRYETEVFDGKKWIPAEEWGRSAAA